MRKFEIASLLPCGNARTSHHLAPATHTFEAVASAFARGTLIRTSNGPIAVEDLLPGDMLETASHGLLPIQWISSTTFVPAQASETTSLTHLTRLLSDSFATAYNLGDVMFGPAARLLHSRSALEKSIGVKSVLTPARDFEDGHSVLQITPPSPVRLFHIRLVPHAIIFANGRPVESFHPGRDTHETMGEAAKALYLSLFPDVECFGDFGPLCHPRMSRETLDSLTGY